MSAELVRMVEETSPGKTYQVGQKGQKNLQWLDALPS